MFNTAISSIMEFVNAFYAFQDKQANPSLLREASDTLIKMLAPFAPHITEELWERTGGQGSVHVQRWPRYDATAIQELNVEIALQINGKVRDKIVVDASLNKSAMEKAALAQPRVQKLLAGKEVVKVIAVPKRLVNIVVR